MKFQHLFSAAIIIVFTSCNNESKETKTEPTTEAKQEQKKEYHIDNERSGDLVLIAPADKWFAYPWWLDPERAPTFARTVDIHRKPGYDPLELFFDPAAKGISFDTNLVKGSHGRVPDKEDEMGLFISSVPVIEKIKSPVHAIQISSILESILVSK